MVPSNPCLPSSAPENGQSIDNHNQEQNVGEDEQETGSGEEQDFDMPKEETENQRLVEAENVDDDQETNQEVGDYREEEEEEEEKEEPHASTPATLQTDEVREDELMEVKHSDTAASESVEGKGAERSFLHSGCKRRESSADENGEDEQEQQAHKDDEKQKQEDQEVEKQQEDEGGQLHLIIKFSEDKVCSDEEEKKEEEEEERFEGEIGKPIFEDEIVENCYDTDDPRDREILKTMIVYKLNNCFFPNIRQLHHFIKNSGKFQISADELAIKLSALEAKFNRIVEERGMNPAFENPYHREMFNLSKKVWVPNIRKWGFMETAEDFGL